MNKVQMPEVMAHINRQIAAANLFFGSVNDAERILLYVKTLEKQRVDQVARIEELSAELSRAAGSIAELGRQVQAQPKSRKAQRLADLEAAVAEIRETCLDIAGRADETAANLEELKQRIDRI